MGQNKLGEAMDLFFDKGGGVHCFQTSKGFFFMPHRHTFALFSDTKGAIFVHASLSDIFNQ